MIKKEKIYLYDIRVESYLHFTKLDPLFGQLAVKGGEFHYE